MGGTKPHSCNKPDQGKQLLLAEHQASFLIILLFVLMCPDRRKESWGSQMRHRFNQDSCCPSFKKSFNRMTDVPPGNLVFSLLLSLSLCLSPSPSPSLPPFLFLLPLTSLYQQWQSFPCVSQGSLPCCQLPAFVQMLLVFQPAC